MIGKTTTQSTDPEDNAAVNAAYNHLNGLLPIASQHYFGADAKPVDGSAIAAAKEDADLYVAHSLAGILFQASEDHLLLVLGTFIGGAIPRYALYTVIRGAIEAAAWCCWLEDPAISTTDRVARALTERFTSISALSKLGRAPKFDKQVAQMMSVASKYKIKPKNNKNAELIAFGKARPKVTDLLISLMPDATPETNGLPLGDHTYKTLSARAHATGWALVEGAVPVAKADDHSKLMYITVAIPELLRVLRIASDLHCRAVRQRLQLAGQSEHEFTAGITGLTPYKPSAPGQR